MHQISKKPMIQDSIQCAVNSGATIVVTQECNQCYSQPAKILCTCPKEVRRTLSVDRVGGGDTRREEARMTQGKAQ